MSLSWPHAVWFATWVGQIIIRIPHSQQNKDNTITKQKIPLIDQIALGSMIATMGLGPVTYNVTLLLRDTFFFGDYEVPFFGQVLGAVLAVPGLYLFHRSHADLGRNWSAQLEIREGHTLVTNGIYAHMRHPMYTAIWLLAFSQVFVLPNYIREGHTLVTNGVYAHMRHPMYTAIWFLAFSQVLVLPNYVCSLPVIGAFLLLCITRIPKEEEMMRQEFGTQYDKYCRTTARLIPNVL